jgi:hypothetical protein
MNGTLNMPPYKCLGTDVTGVSFLFEKVLNATV